MNLLNNIVRWLLVAITLTCGVFIVIIAYTVKIMKEIKQHRVAGARVSDTSARIPARNYTAVHFHQCSGKIIDVTKLIKGK